MFEQLSERDIQCPYCWETFTIFLEPELDRDEQVIDCEVCCRPIVVLAAFGQVLSVDRES
ncbi:MAG: CPXCG motif-containing cysteine-rich protein [Pseudomonadota bacterium]